LRPENTLAAFEYAIEVGVDVVEMDLAVTKDDRIVVIHDLALNPHLCLGPKGKRIVGRHPVRGMALATLRGYDCGSLKNDAYPRQVPAPGQRIPTLEEVLELVAGADATDKARRIRLNLEMKSVPARKELSPPPEKFAGLLVKALRAGGMVERVVVQSFDHRCLAEVKRLEPKIRISALISKNLPDLPELARDLGAEIVSPNQDWITAPVVKALHAAGVRVIPWTVNTEKDWARMLEIGVDGIITDDPAGLIDYLRGRGLR
jgi:glycerophosphoryl diester phosphodiesterase